MREGQVNGGTVNPTNSAWFGVSEGNRTPGLQGHNLTL